MYIAFMNSCVPHVCKCLWRSENIRYPKIGVRKDIEPPNRCWELNPDPLQEL